MSWRNESSYFSYLFLSTLNFSHRLYIQWFRDRMDENRQARVHVVPLLGAMRVIARVPS
jgi:hypothetical protein